MKHSFSLKFKIFVTLISSLVVFNTSRANGEDEYCWVREIETCHVAAGTGAAYYSGCNWVMADDRSIFLSGVTFFNYCYGAFWHSPEGWSTTSDFPFRNGPVICYFVSDLISYETSTDCSGPGIDCGPTIARTVDTVKIYSDPSFDKDCGY